MYDMNLLKECAVDALWWPLLASLVILPLSQMEEDIKLVKKTIIKPKKPEPKVKRHFQMFELKK